MSRKAKPFRVVQPWGKDRGRQATILSEHMTSREAFAEVDRLIARMRAMRVPPDALELVVADGTGNVLQR